MKMRERMVKKLKRKEEKVVVVKNEKGFICLLKMDQFLIPESPSNIESFP